MKTETITKQNGRVHTAFGTSLILEVVSNVSRADIPSSLSLQAAQLQPLSPAQSCAQPQQSTSPFPELTVTKTSRVCASHCLFLWVVTVLTSLPPRTGGTWMAMLI